MSLIDTHCHIHDREFFPDNRQPVYDRAMELGMKLICVGTSEADSLEAVEFAASHDNVWAVVGVHPHDTKSGWMKIEAILGQNNPVVVGIGEIGLDYFYTNSPRQVQIQALEQQLQWAIDYGLPVSFHVREAFDDFWPVFDNFSTNGQPITGVLHSYTDSVANMEKALTRGLAIGVNGISTFARDKQDMYRALPVESICLETDAPFLTPIPHRGKVNEPALLTHVAEHLANLQSINLEELSQATTRCAQRIFSLK